MTKTERQELKSRPLGRSFLMHWDAFTATHPVEAGVLDQDEASPETERAVAVWHAFLVNVRPDLVPADPRERPSGGQAPVPGGLLGSIGASSTSSSFRSLKPAAKPDPTPRAKYPTAPGWWWIKCSHDEQEPVEVRLETVNGVRTLMTRLENISTGRMEWVDVSALNWLGPVNPEPLPMPPVQATL